MTKKVQIEDCNDKVTHVNKCAEVYLSFFTFYFKLKRYHQLQTTHIIFIVVHDFINNL
jgi:hypothetical protein